MKNLETVEAVTHTHTHGYLKRINWKKLCFIIIVIMIILVNIAGIFNTDYWNDECFSINLIQGNVKDIITGTAEDVHPPLYYLILKIGYSLFGDHCYILRGISLIPTIFLIIFSATVAKSEYGRKIALLFIILMSFLENSIIYNVEVRMYSWTNFFVFMVFWNACKIINNNDKSKKNWILFTVFGILAAYTHYYGLISIGVIYLITFIKLIIDDRKNLKKIIICVVACILSYIPWLGYFFSTLSNVQENFWLESIPSVSDCIEFFIGTNILGDLILVILLTAVIILIYKEFKKNIKESKYKQYIKEMMKNEDVQIISMGIITIVMVILIGIVVSKLMRPVFLVRYLFCLMAVVCLCMSIIIFKVLTNKKIGYIIIIITLLSGMYSWYLCYREIWDNNGKTQNIISIIEEDSNENTKIITNVRHLYLDVLDYYFDYPNYNYEKVKYDEYLEGTCYLLLSNTIDEELQKKLEEDERSVEYLNESLFAGRYTIYLYKIY